MIKMISEIPFHQLLSTVAKKYPEKIALIFGPSGAEMSYQTLEEKSDRFANSIQKLGIEKGDRVAMILPNSFEAVLAFFGILKTGAIVVPLNPKYTLTEFEQFISDSETKMVICLDEMAPLFNQLKETTKIQKVISIQEIQKLLNEYSPEYEKVSIYPAKDLAVLQYTAGTTGRPKGVMITHRNMIATVEQLQEAIRLGPEDRQLLLVPPFHVAGIVDCVGITVYTHGRIIIMPKFDPLTALQMISKYRITWIFAVPAMLQAFLRVIQQTGNTWGMESLKLCATGTAKCPLSILKAFSQIGIQIVEGYGLTETTGVCFANFNPNKLGSVGTPFKEVEVKIVDPDGKELPRGEKGEILIKGPNIALGYWKLPEETKRTFKNGWLHSGDVGYLDEDGYLYIFDRIKDIINVRGEKVSSIEVEEVLQSHPAVAEAAVVGIPHSYWGEEIVAFVVLKEQSEPTLLQKYCQKLLADYKVPKRIIPVSHLPRSSIGKVSKRELKKQIAPQ